MNKTCGCSGEATRVCARCGRRLCAWHFVLQPEIVGGALVMQLVCSPSCSYHFAAPVLKVAEWRASA